MSITSSPRAGDLLIVDGKATPQFQDFIDTVGRMLDVAVELSSYTVATLPDVLKYQNSMIFVLDATGGSTVAFSDGSDWRRVQDRAVVS